MFFIIALPIAMAISILRYRLWDIDLVIRRTLQYALLTGLLALVYFGSIVILQSVFRIFIGQHSALTIVISTLLIAALFNPLRLRLQEFIDRRLYRQKYDMERTMAHFSRYSRDEVDMDRLALRLVEVVDETIKPESVALWLRKK